MVCLGGLGDGKVPCSLVWSVRHDPIGSMYGIFAYSLHNQLNAGKDSMHGSYGNVIPPE